MTSANSAILDAVRRLFTASGSADANALAQVIDDLLVPQFVIHGDALLPFSYGKDAVKHQILAFKAVFPDAAVTIQHLFGEGNKAMVHVRIEGTQEQDWCGVPVSHKRAVWTVTAIFRFNAEAKMAEGWLIQDALGLLEQLGRIERIPGQGG